MVTIFPGASLASASFNNAFMQMPGGGSPMNWGQFPGGGFQPGGFSSNGFMPGGYPFNGNSFGNFSGQGFPSQNGFAGDSFSGGFSGFNGSFNNAGFIGQSSNGFWPQQQQGFNGYQGFPGNFPGFPQYNNNPFGQFGQSGGNGSFNNGQFPFTGFNGNFSGNNNGFVGNNGFSGSFTGFQGQMNGYPYQPFNQSGFGNFNNQFNNQFSGQFNGQFNSQFNQFNNQGSQWSQYPGSNGSYQNYYPTYNQGINGVARTSPNPGFNLDTPELANVSALDPIRSFDSGIKDGQTVTLLQDPDFGGFQVIGTGLKAKENKIGIGDVKFVSGKNEIVLNNDDEVFVNGQQVGDLDDDGILAPIRLNDGTIIGGAKLAGPTDSPVEDFVVQNGEYAVSARLQKGDSEKNYFDVTFRELNGIAANNAQGFQAPVSGFGNVGIADLLRIERA